MKLLRITLTSLCLLVSISSFAKVNSFTNLQATQKILKSVEFQKTLAQLGGELSSLSIVQKNDSNALQAFELNATVTVNSTNENAPLDCRIQVDVFADLDESAPAGVTLAKLKEPVVQSPVCQ